jgi:hypothetical protein
MSRSLPVFVALALLAFPAVAGADAGGATIQAVPETEELQAPARHPARTSVGVTVHGCSILARVAVNGEKYVDGKIVWAFYRLVGTRWRRISGGTTEFERPFAPVKASVGTYRFSARFLGGEDLLPSKQFANTTFRIKSQSCK